MRETVNATQRAVLGIDDFYQAEFIDDYDFLDDRDVEVTVEDIRAANCVFKAPFNLYGSYMTMSSAFKEDLMATDAV